MEKLTYYQICNLASHGKFNEIPSGYNIIWVGEKPNRKFNETVDGNTIVFTRNSCPTPTRITVTGNVIPVVPENYGEINFDVVEYGDVFIPTRFVLGEVDMIYGENKYQEVNKWRDDVMSTMYSGQHLKKEEFTFDMKIPIKMYDIFLKDVMLCSLVDEEYMIKAEIVYDYFEIKEKSNQCQ